MSNKDSKIKFRKIISYIDLLAKKGAELKEPYVKHIEGEIWELRPLRDRILFAYIEKTKKTPKDEIEKAKRILKKYKERCEEDE